MRKINLTELNQQVKIQQAVNVIDGFGGFISIWADFEEVWAKVLPMSLVKNAIQGVKGQQITHTLVLRFRADLNASMRIILEDKILEIDRVYELEEQKYLQIDAIMRGKCC